MEKQKDLSFTGEPNERTMSSREISAITGKLHQHVRRDIDKLNVEYRKMGMSIVGQTPFIHPQNNQTYYEYQLTFMQTMDLMTGYHTDLRIKVNRRWKELEDKNKIDVPKTLPEALRAYADEVEKREAAEKALKEAEPKIAIAETALRDKEKQYSIRDAGKHLGLHQSEIFEIMRTKRLLTTRDLPTQKALNEGVLSIKSSPDRKGKNRPQAVMTMENIMKFNERYNKFELTG